MILLTPNEIISLHESMITNTGGSNGIRDFGMLESAVYGAYASFDGNDVYPTISEKAARLAYSIIKNHAFVDGNKRTGIFVMIITLEINSMILNCTDSELVDLGLGIADGTIGYSDILTWLTNHTI
jgi:death-on-curing family protein